VNVCQFPLFAGVDSRAGDEFSPRVAFTELFTAPRLFCCSNVCVERPVFAELALEGGVNVRHPGRLDCEDTAPFVRPEFTAAEDPEKPRLPSKEDCVRAAPLDAPIARELPLKKCCEDGAALRIADALASRPDGL